MRRYLPTACLAAALAGATWFATGCQSAEGSFFDEPTTGTGTGATGTGMTQVCDDTTAAGGAASVTCSDIAAVDGHTLFLRIVGRSEDVTVTEDALLVAFNGDTTAGNYESPYQRGGSLTADGVGGATREIGRVTPDDINTSETANFGVIHCQIPFYSYTTTWKIVLCEVGNERDDASPYYVWHRAVTWRSTAAITSAAFTLNSGSDIAEGTRITMWTGP